MLTLGLDEASFGVLQGWRLRHFPAARNHLPAHLTLLHTLSVDQVARLQSAWPSLQRRAPVDLAFTRPRSLGNGVAIEVESDELPAVRARLMTAMAGTFTRQDLQPFRAHVTIQNKVDAAVARDLHATLARTFESWRGRGTAVLVWRYLGGPWAAESTLPFEV